MKKYLFTAIIAVFACAYTGHAQVSAEKRAEIDKMLRLTGMEKLVEQMRDQMISALQSQTADVPQAFWAKFREKMNTRELVEKIVPLYDKYYTVEDLKAVNAFYESPAGQKILSTMPQLMQDSMKVGQEWGKKIGEQALAEIAAEKNKK